MKNIIIAILCFFQAYLVTGQVLNTSIATQLYDQRGNTIAKVNKGAKLYALDLKRASDNSVAYKVRYNGLDGWVFNAHILYDDDYYRTCKILESKPAFVSSYVPAVNNVIHLRKKQSGTYTIACKINGIAMEFIFDTGASDVTISMTEAMFLLKSGKLKESDFIGTEEYKIANGDIQQGSKIILKEVEFGGIKLYNVEASIVHTLDAPLLMGQSALSRLGQILIDYNNNTLTIIK